MDVFEMSHKFNFKDRLELDRYTLSLADMLATKTPDCGNEREETSKTSSACSSTMM